MLYFQEVLGKIPYPETVYPEIFRSFTKSLQTNDRIFLQIAL
jgi:hypothetical protein